MAARAAAAEAPGAELRRREVFKAELRCREAPGAAPRGREAPVGRCLCSEALRGREAPVRRCSASGADPLGEEAPKYRLNRSIMLSSAMLDGTMSTAKAACMSMVQPRGRHQGFSSRYLGT